MKYANKTELQQSIKSFLRQRKHFYRATGQTHLANLCYNLEVYFDQIHMWNYWRHCLEVKNQASRLFLIAPSRTGGHASIWFSLSELINHCRAVASIPMEQYLSQRLQKEFIHDTASLPHSTPSSRFDKRSESIPGSQTTKY